MHYAIFVVEYTEVSRTATVIHGHLVLATAHNRGTAGKAEGEDSNQQQATQRSILTHLNFLRINPSDDASPCCSRSREYRRGLRFATRSDHVNLTAVRRKMCGPHKLSAEIAAADPDWVPLAVANVAFRSANAAFFCGAKGDVGIAILGCAKVEFVTLSELSGFCSGRMVITIQNREKQSERLATCFRAQGTQCTTKASGRKEITRKLG